MNADPVRYAHTQTGWALRAALYAIAALAFVPGIARSTPDDAAVFVPIALLAAALVAATLFSTLTIEVTDAAVRWYYGIGWPAWELRRIELDAADAAAVDYRLGIWWRTERGTVFQVAVGEAVALTTDDAEYLVSTDDAAGVLRALGALETA